MKKNKIINLLLIFSIIILISSGCIYFYLKNNNLNKDINGKENSLITKKNENESLKKESEELDKKIEDVKNNKKEELEELEVWKKMEEKLK